MLNENETHIEDESIDINQFDDGETLQKDDRDKSFELRPIDAVYDVPVTISAILGTARLPVNELLKLTRGSVIELDRHVGDAIDIMVNNRLVAKGEVIILEEKVAITLTDVVKILK
jgi:flagellar motor switch protein FliN/FliY